MDIKTSDILELKKQHPCGSKEWIVLRAGMDFKMRCKGCGHIIIVPRNKIEPRIKKISRNDTSSSDM